jgi:hypothetical protein
VFQHVGTLANGDELHQFTFQYTRGTFKIDQVLSTAWGSQPGQFNIVVKDEGGQKSPHTYPYLLVGNYPVIDNTKGRKKAKSPSYDTTRRYTAPQVIMAGYSPALIDDITDGEFEVVAIVRRGAMDIESVTLNQNGPFQGMMDFAGELENGDLMYTFTYQFQAGNMAEIKDFWGSAEGQFGIEVTDEAATTSHPFPDIYFGDYTAFP